MSLNNPGSRPTTILCMGCGARVVPGSRFCVCCGRALQSIEPTPSAGQPAGLPHVCSCPQHRLSSSDTAGIKLVGIVIAVVVICALLYVYEGMSRNHLPAPPSPSQTQPVNQPVPVQAPPSSDEIPSIDVGSLDLPGFGAFALSGGNLQGVPLLDKDHPLRAFQEMPTVGGDVTLVVDLAEFLQPALVHLIEQTEMPSFSNPRGNRVDLTDQIERGLTDQPIPRSHHLGVAIRCRRGQHLAPGIYGVLITVTGSPIYPFRVR